MTMWFLGGGVGHSFHYTIRRADRGVEDSEDLQGLGDMLEEMPSGNIEGDEDEDAEDEEEESDDDALSSDDTDGLELDMDDGYGSPG
jgi:hypothetical protein